jgi:phospholipase/lecithinase/hemolysin
MIPSTTVSRRLALAVAGTALAVSALLAGCGGGTTQAEAFVPQRLIAFGDESSLLTVTPDGNGRKFGVNVLTADGNAIDCAQQPLWVQALAGVYGFAFAECKGTATEFRAVMRAGANARVADLEAQIDAQVAAGGFRSTDLVTVLVGTHDILDLYAQFPTRSADALRAEAAARGERLANAVNRLVGLGAKVILANLPDLGLTPFARKQKALFTDTDRAALIASLSTAFNDQLGVKIVLDGRFIGLVQTDLLTRAIERAPFFYGIANATDGICTAPLPECTSATVVSAGTPPVPASAANYLWADDTRPAYGLHVQLATLAIDRARRNPF